MASDAEIQFVQDYLGLAHGTSDAFLETLVDLANRVIHKFVGYNLTDDADTYTEYLDGTGSDVFWTRRTQISSVTSIHISSVGDWDDVAPVDLTSVLFDTADLGKVSLLGLGTGTGFRAIKIVYAGGYSTLPDDVQIARAMIVAMIRNRGKEGADGFKRERLGDRNVEYDAELLPQPAREILDHYKRRYL